MAVQPSVPVVQKPPPLVVVAYRLLGWRVGPAHREWVHDDITRDGWLLRQGAPALSALLALGWTATAIVGGQPARITTLVIVLAGAGLFLRQSMRERALRQQGVDAAGNPTTASWYADESARLRRNLLGATSTVVLVGVSLTILALRSRT